MISKQGAFKLMHSCKKAPELPHLHAEHSANQLTVCTILQPTKLTGGRMLNFRFTAGASVEQSDWRQAGLHRDGKKAETDVRPPPASTRPMIIDTAELYTELLTIYFGSSFL